MNPRLKRMLYFSPLILLGFALFVALGGYVIMSLWNWLLPPLFGWKTITFWQGLALLVLCRLLFGGLGRPGGGTSGRRRHLRDRFATMSPEERQQFRDRLREKGFRPDDEASEAKS